MAKKILIIDDEVEFTDIAERRLKAMGFAVYVANDGETGFELARTARPNAIVLDVEMPRKDGYSFVREYKEQISQDLSPIIMLTVKDKMKDFFEIEGVQDYIVKPFDFEELVLKIRQRLEVQEQAR